MEVLNELSILILNIPFEIIALGCWWRIAMIVVEITWGLGGLMLIHCWCHYIWPCYKYIVYVCLLGGERGCTPYVIMFINTLHMYICLGGERGWTPFKVSWSECTGWKTQNFIYTWVPIPSDEISVKWQVWSGYVSFA